MLLDHLEVSLGDFLNFLQAGVRKSVALEGDFREGNVFVEGL